DLSGAADWPGGVGDDSRVDVFRAEIRTAARECEKAAPLRVNVCAEPSGARLLVSCVGRHCRRQCGALERPEKPDGAREAGALATPRPRGWHGPATTRHHPLLPYSGHD